MNPSSAIDEPKESRVASDIKIGNLSEKIEAETKSIDC